MTFSFRRLTAASAAVALLAAPTLASAAPANPAASLSLAKGVRTGSPTGKTSKLGAAVPTTTLISIGVLAALTGIVLAVTGGDDGSDSN